MSRIFEFGTSTAHAQDQKRGRVWLRWLSQDVIAHVMITSFIAIGLALILGVIGCFVLLHYIDAYKAERRLQRILGARK